MTSTEADGQVKVRSAGGTIGFPADLVLRIERGDGLERQAAKRLQAMAPNDVEGRVELALELEQAGASTLAQRILESVLDLDPDHPAARRALGYVRCDDEWTTDEECHRRRGEVLYQGRWVGSDEHAALEALDHARRANELERLRSEIQLESARLQADRAAASMSYGGDYALSLRSLLLRRRSLLPWATSRLRLPRAAAIRPAAAFPDHHGRFDGGRRFGHPGRPALGRRAPLRGWPASRGRAAGASADAHAHAAARCRRRGSSSHDASAARPYASRDAAARPSALSIAWSIV